MGNRTNRLLADELPVASNDATNAKRKGFLGFGGFGGLTGLAAFLIGYRRPA
ncbi:hypothetical protein [Streptomyces sp. AK02-04a]|uniref:hypothetical protein n=1 Tax=Streptomyces sp. AK02-04a TaxID=3028649 RepID=UPI0029B81C92|nr:hypothetical protein [Streptomyces sp. AK02-04a]MDX3761703.1 hypothetical protein [Streptomyces sp. AK02-04a]